MLVLYSWQKSQTINDSIFNQDSVCGQTLVTDIVAEYKI